jgi:hypothetical protein
VGSRSGLNTMEMRTIFPCQESNPGYPSRSPSPYTDSAIPQLYILYKDKIISEGNEPETAV